MATVTYSDYYESRQKKFTATPKDFKVGYFNSLKDDGDEAIVRFAYSDVKEFDFQTVHVIKVGDKFKRVACLRTSALEAEDKCPLCASGDKYKTKFYVKLVEYTKDDNGNIVASAKVWERPASFNKKIVGALNNAIDMGLYPNTSTIGDVVFKIKRIGQKGSMDTEYEVIPANPNVFKPELYLKNFVDFDGLDLAHHSYASKSKEDIATYLSTGEFPTKVKEESTSTTVTPVQETPTPTTTTATPTTSTETVGPRRYTF